ncbi:MAG: antitoxin Xre/MbcA/ParS toxin-binding domain-containing protein [Reyranella sp.]|uniref:antitoxin Xre/MbcA/ParS toxin-binding domain-containing protein n=1 Tax=Reyranella sp. TaxID=1929291 RepID=UPI003D0EBDBB
MDGIEPRYVDSLTAVVQRIVDESGNPEGFDAHAWTLKWIQERVPALGGARPIDYMGTAEGRALIETLILQMQSGAYS